ncbi:hypothetical protein ABPG74_018775 [Tetrahymena malaccensis]
MNMLSQENLNQLVSNNFLQYIINENKCKGQVNFTDINNLKRFISFLYFCNNRDLYEQNYAELFNSEIIQNFLEGKINYQIEEMPSIDQNQNIKNDEIEKQNQDLEPNLSNINDNFDDSEYGKEQYFQFLEEYKMKIPNPTQEVSQILQKYSHLKVEKDCTPFKVNADSYIQYQYQYKCIGMEIQPFISKPLDTKQEAKAQAARLLFPHLKFYDKYREPYQQYTYNEKDQKQEEQMGDDEFYQKQVEDLFQYMQIQEEGTNSISEVQEILQKQDNKQSQYYIKEDYSRQDNGNVLCKATFMVPNKIESYAFGKNNKMAKEIAFYKLIKPIKKYFYELNGSYYSEFAEQKPKRNYKKRNANNDDENQDQ